MNIQVAVLCDAATDDNGKLNLLGAFDTIYAPQMPAVHPQCSVALRVTFMPGDEGTRKLSLNFINADGRSIMQAIELPVPVTLPDEAHFLTRNFIINIQQLKFAEAGLYSVDVRVDDQSQACLLVPRCLLDENIRGLAQTRCSCPMFVHFDEQGERRRRAWTRYAVRASLRAYRWQPHCHGLYHTPRAA